MSATHYYLVEHQYTGMFCHNQHDLHNDMLFVLQHLSFEHCVCVMTLGVKTARASLCPWGNRGKANSWRPPSKHKNLQKKKKMQSFAIL
jgi:hypothetical protein